MRERERWNDEQAVRHGGRRLGAALAATIAIAVFASAALAGDAPIPAEVAAPKPGDAKGEASGIEITSTRSSWDNLSELFFGATPAAPFGEGSVFVMRGELKNATTHPVHHVVLRYELLDENGKVLHDVEGYNRGAEDMRPDEEGSVHAEKVRPIPAGGTDSYRMVFFHDEVPRFHSQRVRVSEVHEK